MRGFSFFFSPIIAFALSLSAFIVLMTLRITRAMHINGINLGRGSQRIRRRPPTDRNPVNVDGAGNRPVAVRGVSSNKGGHGNSGAEDEAMSANDQCISTNESNSGDSDGVGDEAQGELQNVSCYSSDEGSPGEFVANP